MVKTVKPRGRGRALDRRPTRKQKGDDQAKLDKLINEIRAEERDRNQTSQMMGVAEEIATEGVRHSSGAMGDMGMAPLVDPLQVAVKRRKLFVEGSRRIGRLRVQEGALDDAKVIAAELEDFNNMTLMEFDDFLNRNPQYEIASNQALERLPPEDSFPVPVPSEPPTRPNIGVPDGSTVFTGEDVTPSETNPNISTTQTSSDSVMRDSTGAGAVAQDQLQRMEDDDAGAANAAQQAQTEALTSMDNSTFTDLGVSTSAQSIASMAAPPKPPRGGAAIARPFLQASRAALDAAFAGLRNNAGNAAQTTTGMGDVGAPGPAASVLGATAIGNQRIAGEHRTHNISTAKMLLRRFHVML